MFKQKKGDLCKKSKAMHGSTIPLSFSKGGIASRFVSAEESQLSKATLPHGIRAETEPHRELLRGQDDNKVLIGDVRDGVCASLSLYVWLCN